MYTMNITGAKITGMRGSHLPDGTSPFVLASWLQKAIRRGLLEQALYVASALHAMGTSGEEGAPLLTFLCNRLIVISLEDVGVARSATFLRVVHP